ncbi:MAG: methyltransferase domain-containing protein [Pseudomonadota bacterium]
MHLDVRDLRNFYYRTGLGRIAQRAIREQVAEFWPDLSERTLVGFGFAAPFLRPYKGKARRVMGLMPAQQGVMHWPPGEANVSVLCEETLWPVETGAVDRLLLIHGLETSENPSALLEESWRVLAPEGRVLFIVPNRAGLWARRDATPFGFGRPYTAAQLEAQLRRHDFAPGRHLAALFQPPSTQRFWMKTARYWERLGRGVSNSLAGGVILAEATKHVEAPRRPGLPEAVRKPLEVLDGIARPVPKPVGSPRK